VTTFEKEKQGFVCLCKRGVMPGKFHEWYGQLLAKALAKHFLSEPQQ